MGHGIMLYVRRSFGPTDSYLFFISRQMRGIHAYAWAYAVRNITIGNFLRFQQRPSTLDKRIREESSFPIQCQFFLDFRNAVMNLVFSINRFLCYSL